MCGRYTLTTTIDFKKRFGIFGEVPQIKPNYNITPGTYNPVIVKNSPNRMVMMKWGLIPFWAKNYKVETGFINARAEGIMNKNSFKKPIVEQRCLIPTTGFYEWKKLKLESVEEKIPFYIGLKRLGMFSFAGIYDVWRDANNKEVYSYAIVTTSANEMMQNIHHRMPAILKPDNEAQYLDKSIDISKILSLLRPFNSKEMFSYPVSRLVNNPNNNGEEIIARINVPGK